MIFQLKTAVIVTAAMTFGYSTGARAGASDYEFQLVTPELKQGDAEIAVRLLDKRTSASVSGAVIFAKRIDMEPDGMEAMTSKLEAAPSSQPDIYRFQTTLTMEGRWRLSLAAKVPGETETVQTKLIVKALP